MLRSLIFVLALAVVPAALAQSSGDSPGPGRAVHVSGIEGKVVLTGSCPGPQRVGETCASRPYQGELAVRRISNQKVAATTKSDKDGQFRVVVPPGKYFITQAGEARYPMIHSPEIIAVKHKFTRVEIQADLGIR